MCLAIPGQIIAIDEPLRGKPNSPSDSPAEVALRRMAKVSFGGIVKTVSLAYVPEAQVGDYAIVHVGFALSILDQEEALQTLQELAQIQA